MSFAALTALPRKRHAARKDTAQAPIVEALRTAGATVQVLDAKGVPDLLVGWCGANFLLEVKTADRRGGKENAAGTLKRQADWHRAWRGQVSIVHTPREALQVIGVLRHD